MEFTNYKGKAGREALINELKGNLFEYIVGHHLSRLLRIEEQFIGNFDLGLKRRFFQYESKLRELDPDLLRELPNMAQIVASKIVDEIEETFFCSFVVVIFPFAHVGAPSPAVEFRFVLPL